jgi:hypothetical protein
VFSFLFHSLLGIRKIKFEMVEDPGYPFSMGIVWYDRSQGYSDMHFGEIKINLTDQTFNVIAEEIKYQINSFLQDCGTPHRFNHNTRYDNAINIVWTNGNGSTDIFELQLLNEFTFGHFKLEGGASSYSSHAQIINKDNYELYILPWAEINGVCDRYNPMPNYDINNLYFHWDISKSDNYVCEIESVVMNSKSGGVLMKKYGVQDIKLFRLNDGPQHCKIWFTNDGINIIPLWFKRLLIEYVMFY